MTSSDLVAVIDSERQHGNLSSAMRNVDSKFEWSPHERFAAAALWIRILRIIDQSPSFSADC